MREYNEIVHMLNYLIPEQWADALEDREFNKEIIYELMRIQEEAYNFSLIEDVEYFVEKKKEKKRKRS